MHTVNTTASDGLWNLPKQEIVDELLIGEKIVKRCAGGQKRRRQPQVVVASVVVEITREFQPRAVR